MMYGRYDGVVSPALRIDATDVIFSEGKPRMGRIVCGTISIGR